LFCEAKSEPHGEERILPPLFFRRKNATAHAGAMPSKLCRIYPPLFCESPVNKNAPQYLHHEAHLSADLS